MVNSNISVKPFSYTSMGQMFAYNFLLFLRKKY